MTPPARGRGTSQRSPTVLVTDSRDQQQPQIPRRRRSPATRFITVDNVLQYASDVPSMQQRGPPPISRSRRLASAAGGLITSAGSSSSSAVAGSGGTMSRLAAQPRLPPRTTKVSEKLVLLPDTGELEDGETEEDDDDSDGADLVDEELVARLAKEKNVDPERIRHQLLVSKRLGGDFGVDNDLSPLLAEEEVSKKRRVAPERAKSYAERLPKARRTEKLARVTAYCTAQAYKMGSLATFVKEQHGGRTKLYDDCLYTAYHLPLLPGHEGYRLRSSPVLKYPGGKSLLDEEIERNELRDYHDEYMLETEEHSVGGHNRPEDEHHYEGSPRQPEGHDPQEENREEFLNRISEEVHGHLPDDHGHEHAASSGESVDGLHHIPPLPQPDSNEGTRQSSPEPALRRRRHSTDDSHALIRDRPSPPVPTPSSSSTQQAPARTLYNVAEMFVFSYGVVVFWNFTERQEKDLLADLAFATSSATGIPTPLATMPLDEEDFETEEFHFEYSTEISRPRVYNDMITLRSGDHMIKLAISHGISQSTKLCFFEEVMARQMADAKDVPRRLAVTGQLGMKREEVFRILGRLFKSRVEVNLSSNMLDVPNFFWESEPTLYPLYIAVREYLEIKPRIQVLNERCRVFLDLAEILSDSIADSRTSHQTWIIIVLIIISIIVTISEVFLRFGLLHASQGSAGTPASILARVMGRSVTPSPPPEWYPYSGADAPPGCICPSLGPAGAGSGMGVSGMMGY
ncbi:YagE family protein [Penicillium digitatum]|uniref:YagE family protein n=3 Tax=Penicillium digitatum TaxID=36651 RepID=K9FXP6_PEND2|nr:YagE family protein [Penicillium digitatum Pd1]EKV13317.1 YagE family protein [Penicillium digitatum PHI26]EKV19191.1 YagE family protein [Penicillium digitatum Pd1]QQK42915.1 YagE family protein [Penicillium digitatum]